MSLASPRREPRPEALNLSAPDIGPEEEQAVAEVLRSGWVTTGPVTGKFEEQLRLMTSCPFAVALNSCTAALQLALEGLGVGPGDEVAVPAITFPATANAVLHLGAEPVVVDVDPGTANMDPQQLRAVLGERTRAVVPVHMAGLPAAMREITTAAHEVGAVVVEDAAQAIGASVDNVPIGVLPGTAATCFSFQATKIVTTVEGGAILTPDEALARRARLMRAHGISKDSWDRQSTADHWEAVLPGFRFNMTDVSAAIGCTQLGRLDEMLRKRRHVTDRYLERLEDFDAAEPLAGSSVPGRVWSLFIVRLIGPQPARLRSALRERLSAQGIGTGIHFRSLHLQPLLRGRPGVNADRLPVAADLSDRLLTLPLSSRMQPEDADRVVEALKDAMMSLDA